MEIPSQLRKGCGKLTTYKKSRNNLVVSVLAISTLFLAGCSTTTKGTPEEQVRQLATQQLRAVQAGKWEQAYQYTLPSYRAVATQEAFKKRFAGVGTWKNVEIANVECETEKCKVIIKIELGALPMRGLRGNIATHVEETWLLEDGQWWLFKQL